MALDSIMDAGREYEQNMSALTGLKEQFLDLLSTTGTYFKYGGLRSMTVSYKRGTYVDIEGEMGEQGDRRGVLISIQTDSNKDELASKKAGELSLEIKIKTGKILDVFYIEDDISFSRVTREVDDNAPEDIGGPEACLGLEQVLKEIRLGKNLNIVDSDFMSEEEIV